MDYCAVTTFHATIKAKEDENPGACVCPECVGITADGREVVVCESYSEWHHAICFGATENFSVSWR